MQVHFVEETELAKYKNYAIKDAKQVWTDIYNLTFTETFHLVNILSTTDILHKHGSGTRIEKLAKTILSKMSPKQREVTYSILKKKASYIDESKLNHIDKYGAETLKIKFMYTKNHGIKVERTVKLKKQSSGKYKVLQEDYSNDSMRLFIGGSAKAFYYNTKEEAEIKFEELSEGMYYRSPKENI